MSPQRIQLSRQKGWRKPEGAVVVARPSRWGNPWTVGDPVEVRYLTYCRGSVGHYSDVRYSADDGMEQTLTPELAVWLYRQSLLAELTPADDELVDDAEYREELQEALDALRGHDLACWCPLEDDDGRRVPCHADVLLELANRDGAS